MKRLMLGNVVALLLLSGPAGATCLYEGVPYSEGARVCMHRTMFMCRGKRWIRTAERCWERDSNQTSPLLHAGQRPPDALTEAKINGLCQNSPQYGVGVTVTSLSVLVYAAASEVRRTRVRAV